ncbi:MAG TPA: Pr6Pr family membrane protein [Gaiella sp.]
MRRGLPLDVARLAFAALAVVAMTHQLDSLGRAKAGNFFSFFTIQSNIAAAAMLALLVVVRRPERTVWFEAVRGGVVFFIAVTGVVFALLLQGLQEELQTTIPWVDTVVHRMMPLVLVVDWLVEGPRHRLPRWVAVAWLGCLGAWLAYTLIRGAIVGWYPYPFVDVSAHGYGGVAFNSAALLVAFAAGAAGFLWLGNRRAGPAVERLDASLGAS